MKSFYWFFLSIFSSCTAPPPLAFPTQTQNKTTADISNPMLPMRDLDLSNGLNPAEAALYTLLHHPSLVALRGARGLAQAALLGANALPNPTLSVGVDAPVVGATEGTNVATSASVGWEVSSYWRRALFQDAATSHLKEVDADIAWQEWELSEDAKRLVWRLYYLGQKTKLTQENQDILKEGYDLLQKAVSLGEKTSLDLSAAEVSWREAQEATFVAQSDEADARGQLKQALGMTQDTPVVESLTPKWKALAKDDLLAKLEERRLDLAALRFAYQGEDAAFRSAVQAARPALSLEVSAGVDNSALGTAGVAAQFELPFLQKNQGEIAAAKASREQLVAQYAATMYEAKQQIEQLCASIERELAHRALVEASIPPLEDLFQKYQKASQGGYLDVFSKYTVQNLIVEKKLALLDIDLNLSELTIDLEIVSGVMLSQ